MSVPKDIMMEELNLSANRGSRMFQERQKRAERFTLESAANGFDNASNVRSREGKKIHHSIIFCPRFCAVYMLDPRLCELSEGPLRSHRVEEQAHRAGWVLNHPWV